MRRYRRTELRTVTVTHACTGRSEGGAQQEREHVLQGRSSSRVQRREKEREVGLGPTAGCALWKYLHQYRPRLAENEHERHVFVGYTGEPLLRNGLGQALQRIGERASIDGVRMSAHTFRHTFARGWLENGGEIFKLSRVLGHSEMQTTQIYLKDFKSREAHADHAQFSPVERLHLGKQKRGNGRHH